MSNDGCVVGPNDGEAVGVSVGKTAKQNRVRVDE